MANLRFLKKTIDYIFEEYRFDCEMSICLQPSKGDEIVQLIKRGVDLRNELFVRANNPVEPHNKSLVRKHYAALYRDMETSFEALFSELSELNK